MREIGLYIHIPFCKRKCYYCDFNSYAGYDYLFDDYIRALLMEIESNSTKDYNVVSVYIGGGTPNLLPPSYIEKILKSVFKNYKILDGCEITIEMNPGLITEEKLKIYKDNGINRVSIGLQAFQNRLLKYIGRIHTVEEFFGNYELVKKFFDNINIDLMYALPTQTFKEWQETLKEVVKLQPTHVSTYSLILEPNTSFYRLYEKGQLPIVDEEEELKMYHWGIEFLKEKGYHHYEISNFALPTFECRHNILYWECKNYLGFGAGAHSYMADVRYSNIENIKDYIKSILERKSAVKEKIKLTKQDRMAEFMFLGMRMTKGVCDKDFKKRFGISLFEIYKKVIQKYLKEGLIEIDNECVKLTERGIDVSNVIFEEFLP
ncbi:radical SAM family heme chaperone HemW [Thermoanaerobacter sp. CM-CNRG TB177]|uniref:Heme chaperone HemW n=2 Tax=Thermoanaerobacter TaxID=1754 RepID=B0KA84_THEP3|nr:MULTISPECIES: radical SAM family heme chaperone HemW [Thermoanaerobacter]ABY93354.1 putative oxygen-independent coproporphyrinogen III oxidase [Thermoanaerobacter sp. X514]ABY95047.1 putative oxygen-independent coproporphyrinogen III oxidase [Thermoanaerobacter pseudethanolicus ATCC 33223]ADV80000.1 oxygen-independent coproporphyrinogen III oxidase [Thermoanaerobacter brockii subsp. finnii Ako-1]MBT1280446.1 oxygen-independent coproporphyrinogen III oxidase [Thermoanaerobacter sp. CM-CNRG TB